MRPAAAILAGSLVCGMALLVPAACDKPSPQPSRAAGADAGKSTVPGAGALLAAGDAGRGKRLYGTLGCAICHPLDGASTSGPSLRRYWMTVRTLDDGREMIADEAYTRRAIIDPMAEVVPGYKVPMTSMKGLITDEQLADLVAYIKSLSNP